MLCRPPRTLGAALGVLLAASVSPSVAESPASEAPPRADVQGVVIRGSAGSYLFQVTVQSPDRGCEQYANWWEVVTLEGELVYRRVLKHSHVNEQPFTRSGGPVPVDADETVIVRAHMAPGGYGGMAYKGSPASGFRGIRLPDDFATVLAQEDPLPESCAY